MTPVSATLDPSEIDKFSRIAGSWWDETGPFAPLHRLNPSRLGYIRDRIAEHFGLDEKNLRPLAGLTVLDVGCGGGLVCEPMTRMGGTVTGVDADAEAIAVARAHAGEGGLAIEYLNGTTDTLILPRDPVQGAQTRDTGSIEDPVHESIPAFAGMTNGKMDQTRTFDIVLALEIVEHVGNVDEFILSLRDLLKPGGLLILSTLNRTPRSFMAAIVGAEYVLRWLPRGTHDWKRFLKPSELARTVRAAGLTVTDVSGLKYDPLTRAFTLNDDVAVNYFMCAAEL